MKYTQNKNLSVRCILLGLCLLSSVAYALEGGVSQFGHGVENIYVGALPPDPGFYGVLYSKYYSTHRLNDYAGHNLQVPNFRVNAFAVIPRFVWRPEGKIMGGDPVIHAIVPLVHLDVRVANNQQSKFGLGDITVGGGLGFHHSEKLHSIVALDSYWPTGSYKKHNLANIGAHHTAIEPVYAISYINPQGINLDARIGYIISQKNSITKYKNGDEFHIDYVGSANISNKWIIGLGGHYGKQINNDKQYGHRLENSKRTSLGIGPTASYNSGKGWLISIKWEKELVAKNTSQGDALWLRFIVPLNTK